MNIIKRIGVKHFVKEIDKDIKVKFQKYDMECDIYEDTVYIGKTYDFRTDKWFMEFVHSIEPNCNYSPFLMSLLHEIGHIMTFDEDNMEQKDIIYGLLNTEYEDKKENEQDVEKYVNLYFRIPLEEEATKWGINFAMKNTKLINKYKWIWR